MNQAIVRWAGPFALFVVFLALGDLLSLGRWEFPVRVAVLGAAIWILSRDVLDFRVRQPLLTIGLGIAVFGIWVAPDLLIPGYRSHWLFQNSITGQLQSSVGEAYRADTMAMTFRFLRAVVIVPIVEELFWRGFLMRWLIKPEFESVPLGAYSAQAFWITAALFAAEHGPYWEVGLIAGAAYNWLMIRTKSLGDCILAHAITNAILCGYVFTAGKWEYL